jgi:pyruvate/2-oxoglutarate dehydrogenase complex dihydrolipoamide dehydrogenase (E3) component
MQFMKHFDSVIIGFGKGGKTLAGALAAKGENVALIEKSSGMYGGTCINVGCIPSKSLVTSSAESARHADEPFEARAARYAAAIAEKRRVTSLLRGKNYHKLADLPNVSVIDGVGSFVSPTEIKITKADGEETVSAGKIFINTGAEAVIPAINGVKGNKYVYTSESLMDEDRLPARLTLIGAGYIGMEFASMYSNFGSAVTVLQDAGLFLPREDRDVADEIRRILEKQGVRFILGAKTTRLDGGTVFYTDENGGENSLESDAVLIATGRRPNTDALNAGAAGVSLTPQGAIKVDAKLRAAENIWAMGDAAGSQQFTYVSLDDFRIVRSQLFGDGSRSTSDRGSVAYSVFMDTPLGRAGISEDQARAQGLGYRVVKLPAAAVPKAQVLRKTDGFLKAVIDSRTGRILGAALLCPEAYEIINIVSLAIDLGLDYTVLRDRIYTHPTMAEAFNDLFSL